MRINWDEKLKTINVTLDYGIVIQSLGSGSGKVAKPISAVSLLGGVGDLQWNQNADALVITKPASVPLLGMPVGFKITFKE